MKITIRRSGTERTSYRDSDLSKPQIIRDISSFVNVGLSVGDILIQEESASYCGARINHDGICSFELSVKEARYVFVEQFIGEITFTCE